MKQSRQTLLDDMEVLTKAIGADIKAIVAAKGMTQLELANKSGKHPGFISNLLNGNNPMTIRTIVHIARVLGFRAVVTFEAIESE